MNRQTLIGLVAALLLGIALRFVVNLDPVWWLAWFVPGLLFALALRESPWSARGLVAIAGLIGASVNMPYLLKVMPLPAVMVVLILQALLWVLVIGGAYRLVKRLESGWAVLALPVVAVAADTLLAWLAPDGNWGSLAYTQMEVLPIAQVASVFGVGGILFLVMLVNSAVALVLSHGLRLRGALAAYATPLVLAAIAAGFGTWRLQTPTGGEPVSFGIASVDDFVMGPETVESREVWAQYDAQVQQLAASGAQVVLLPEKIDVLASADAEARKAALARLARDNHVWLVAGVGVITAQEKRNEAWWFAPDGRLVTNYLKHHLAPPERDFARGGEHPVNEIGGLRYGVAICKDMHFARLGREFGARDAAVMLVPAWDWDDDAWQAANMTKLRGVENGYAIVRASRQGLLSITDAYGRVLAVERSAKLPGATLFETVNVGPRVATVYTRIGDALGWLCVVAAVIATVLAWRGRFGTKG